MPLGPPEDPERFETFDECVDALSDDPELSEEDAENICDAWENRTMNAHSDRSTLRKDVDFVVKDVDDQIATGIVMVPYTVDLQGDWARPETIVQFKNQFETFEDAGEASGGVMHVVWPDEHISLERNEVLSEPTEIGGEEVPAGAWRQDYQFHDDELWGLVEDGILEGYSIGAIDVRWDGPIERDDLPDDVTVPDDIPDGEPVWELTDGIIREVSAVDIPAVPDAEILETKADAEKRLADHLGNRSAFIEEAQERGHSEAEAERLWEYLNDAMEVDGAAEPGKQSVLARAGKAFLSALSGSDGDGASEAPGHTVAKTPAQDPRGATKEGRTLSAANRESLFATIDASLDVLHDAGVDDLPKRFTDRDDVAFDLSEHDARAWEGDHGDGEDGDEEPDDDEEAASAPTANSAPDGDTSDDSTTMSDDDGGDKSLAEKNAEQIDELTDAVKDLTEAVDGDGGNDQPPDGEKTAEVELPNGDVAEVSKAEALSWFEDDGDDPETAEAAATKADIEALHARLDSITRQSGVGSDQIRDDGGSDDEDGLDAIGKALS